MDIFQGIETPGTQEDIVRTVLDGLSYAIVIVDREGRIVYTNKQTTILFGYAPEDLLGRPIEILIPERLRGIHAENRTDYLTDPQTRPMGGGLELTGLRKDGTEFPVDISLSPVKTDNVLLITSVIRDLTEYRKAEEALTDARTLSESLFQKANVMIVILDIKGNITRFNHTAEKIIGYSEAELKGRNWFEILTPKEKYPQVWEEFNRLLAGGPPKTFENPILTKSGEERHIMWENNDLRSNGRVVGMISFGNDITERKRVEESLRESERKMRGVLRDQEQQLIRSERLISFGELTASLAHEFNNPLGIVIGYAQDLMTELDATDPRHQSVKIIEEEARRCKKIMQDLLDFGRQTPPEFKQMAPSELVQKSLELVGGNLQKLGIRTVIRDGHGLPKIWADPQQIEQVLVNLFFNAIEAMPEGGTLTIGFAVRPSQSALQDDLRFEEEVVIHVTDTGPGISPDHLIKIFLPFFTTKSKKGMGLGLSICKSIMEAHGGSISAESPPGRGTTFQLHLPVDRRRSKRDEPIVS